MTAPAKHPPRSAGTAIDFGYATRSTRTRWWSGVIRVRQLAVSGALAAVATAVAMTSLLFGDYPISVGKVISIVFGGGSDFERTIVMDWRLPIALCAVAFGAVLGVGGAIFQSLTRNPLGSPDIIGFDAGAYTAVVVAILVFDTQGYRVLAAASLLGGMATALVVYLLAYRRGIQGFRLIVVGIAVSAMLVSVNTYLITRAELSDAMTVGYWGAGSLTGVTWSSAAPALVAVGVIALASAALAPALRQLEMGDDGATTRGIRTGPVRLALLVVGVATTALVTAAAGPIGFVALVAPQLARRLMRSAGVTLLGAAVMGATLLATAHLLSLMIARYYRPVPVGLITICIGGLYFIWLLVRENRRQYGASR